MMNLTKVEKAYTRWAPHYDLSFGIISDYGRNYVVSQLNKKPSRILEVGVGTGLSLPLYAPDMLVTGIDISQEMLTKAEKRVSDNRLGNIENLSKMDATQMTFEENRFDAATAMYIMSVAPNPEGIMKEIIRVLKPGGDLYIINHFSSEHKVMSILEKTIAPICRFIGWHSVFDMKRLMNFKGIHLVEKKAMRPLGLFQLLHFRKNKE